MTFTSMGTCGHVLVAGFKIHLSQDTTEIDLKLQPSQPTSRPLNMPTIIVRFYFDLINSSISISACFRIALKVPSGMSPE
jgi:hypothetical protein